MYDKSGILRTYGHINETCRVLYIYCRTSHVISLRLSQKKTLEKTEGVIKNEQSRETGSD